MSFTQGEHLFAGVHELGVNDLLRAFFTARPRYLDYRTSGLPATPAMATSIPPIQVSLIPGVILTVELELIFTPTPTVDITPGATPAHLPSIKEFVIKTRVTFSSVSASINGTLFPIPPAPPPLDVFGFCEPVVTSIPSGTGDIGINLKRVETDPVADWITNLVIFAFLKDALDKVHIPFNTLTVGAFGLILLAGPVAETDQIKVWGNAL